MNPQANNDQKEFQLDCSATVDPTARHDSAGGGGGNGGGGARYKLMSPAKLPISRSTDMTIPPRLSPTSFLESPVFISNIKIIVIIYHSNCHLIFASLHRVFTIRVYQVPLRFFDVVNNLRSVFGFRVFFISIAFVFA